MIQTEYSHHFELVSNATSHLTVLLSLVDISAIAPDTKRYKNRVLLIT